MSDKKYNKEDCLILLQNKYQELQKEGLSRYPQRSDFEDREVVAIKAFLGPWPRALEAAGIKPPREDDVKRIPQMGNHPCVLRNRTSDGSHPRLRNGHLPYDRR